MTRTVLALSCPVRNCHLPLACATRQWACPAGHSFDVARSGYCNLLQPNERRSRNPGDSREAVEARRRLFERGIGARFLDDLARIAADAGAAGPILDAGCGEGFHLAALSTRFDTDGVGIDISTPAIDLAARTHRGPLWVVANVDRRLPIADRSIGLIVSVTSRVNAREFARVIRPGGLLVVALPGPDDLVELRERILGDATCLARTTNDLDALDDAFTRVRRHESREVVGAGPDVVADLLRSTYRGRRHSQRAAVESVTSLRITQSRLIDVLRARA